jgi:hypothetical protein
MAKTEAQLSTLRKDLIGRIMASDLVWRSVYLRGGVRVDVTMPVFKDGYFVPATAAELWALAAKFRVFPLTRAVADQVHNDAQYVPKKDMRWQDQLLDFEVYSEYLRNPSRYGDGTGIQHVSGAHKFWVLSAAGGKDPKAINYGFHIEAAKFSGRERGPYLDPNYTVIQGLGGAHDANHWDYSQLIQFMRPSDKDGPPVNLRDALLSGQAAVWDESPRSLGENRLPF